MATVLLKNGEVKEIPDDEMLSFLQENRDLIENQQSPRRRPIKRVESANVSSTNTK